MNKTLLTLTKSPCTNGHIHVAINGDENLERPLTLQIARQIDRDEESRFLHSDFSYKNWYINSFRKGEISTTEKFHTIREVFEMLQKPTTFYEICCDLSLNKELEEFKKEESIVGNNGKVLTSESREQNRE